MKNLSHILLKELDESGLPRCEFARKLGISYQTLTHYITGHRKPSATNLIKIADGLQCSIDYLLGRSAK